MEFKDMLVSLRKRDNYTQEEASKSLGIPRSTLAGYETGKREPDLEMLRKIADLYHVDMDTLLVRNLSEEKIKAVESSTAKKMLKDIVDALPEEKVQSLINILRR